MNHAGPQDNRVVLVPRGVQKAMLEHGPLKLGMDIIDEAERRLHEVRLANPATRNELCGLFNQAANTCGKYQAWIEYEILRADKAHKLDRAVVILEKATEEAKRLKELGIKMNEDLREALISRDEACAASLETLNELKAMKALLESHFWSFIRAHNSCIEVAQSRGFAPTPQFNGSEGQTYNIPQMNFMGKDERKKE